MKLKRVVIEGYRSFVEKTEVHFDSNVTVILGANDHGKSNLLDALTHLNRDTPFDAEKDLNWDKEDDKSALPRIDFELALTKDDQTALKKAETDFREKLASAASDAAEAKAALDVAESARSAADAQLVEATKSLEVATAAGVADAIQAATATQTTATEQAAAATQAFKAAADTHAARSALALKADEGATEGNLNVLRRVPSAPDVMTLWRAGVAGELEFATLEGFHAEAILAFLDTNLPRVELFQPQQRVADSVTATDLATESHDFMRGIFYYAGLNPLDCANLFEQNDRTQKKLRDASVTLNQTLRAGWSQGKTLEFVLTHRGTEIDLRIKDPSVQTTDVRASRRSSGFTHFFNLQTTLHARQKEHDAQSYIFLFDEPGIYLHPDGQNDLLRVLEVLGNANQVVYSTHSVFMINRTFPARHRLVVKGTTGTTIDAKPFRHRWGVTLDALGVSAAGTILFAKNVLLGEGDSEPMLIPAIYQALARVGKTKVDLNSLAVLGTDDGQKADVLIRILSEAPSDLVLAVLVDGDAGGKARLTQLKDLLTAKDIKSKALPDGETIEDCLPLTETLYVEAVGRYAAKMQTGKKDAHVSVDKMIASARASYVEWAKENKVGIGAWGSTTCTELAKLTGPPSKLGIAREYVTLLDEQDNQALGMKHPRAEKLVALINELLPLPELDDLSRDVFVA